MEENSVGPAYKQMAQKYAAQNDALPYLTSKIIKGSVGVWGEAAMPAHPDLKNEDAQQIVSWILSLSDKKGDQKTLPQAGTIIPTPKKGKEVMTLQATYTDNGGGGVRPLSGSSAVVLRPALMDARELKQFTGFTTKDSAGNLYLQFPQNTGSITIPQVDLTGIKAINLITCCSSAPFTGSVQIRLGTAEGGIAGNADVAWKSSSQAVVVPVQKGGNKIQDIVIVYTLKGKEQQLGRPLLRAIRFVPQ